MLHPVLTEWLTRLGATTTATAPSVPERFASLPGALQRLAALGEVTEARELRATDLKLITPTFRTLDALLAGEAVSYAITLTEDPDAFELDQDDYDNDLDEPPMVEASHTVQLEDGALVCHGRPFDDALSQLALEAGDNALRAAGRRHLSAKKYFAEDYVVVDEGVRLAPLRELPGNAQAATFGPRVETSPYAVRVHRSEGAPTVAFRGWWILDAVAAHHGTVACLVAQRKSVKLDPKHPDFKLTSAAGKTTAKQPVVESHGALYLVSTRAMARARVGLLGSIVHTASQGRLIAVREPLHLDAHWGTALFITDGTHLTPVAVFDTDIGELLEDGGRIFGSHGFEILGVKEALAQTSFYTPDKLTPALTLPEPPPPPAAALDVHEGALEAKHADRDDPFGQAPPLDDADWVSTWGPSGAALVGQELKTGWKLTLHFQDGTKLPLPAETKAPLFSLSMTSDSCFVGANNSVWRIDLEQRTVERVIDLDFPVTDVSASGDVLYVLMNLHEAESELLRFVRRPAPEGWSQRGGFPVTGMTSLGSAAAGSLLALTIREAPKALAFTFFFTFDGDRPRMLGRVAKWMSGMWDDDGIAYARFERNATYALSFPPEPQPPTAGEEFALAYDVREGGYGQRSFFIRRESDYGYVNTSDELLGGFRFPEAKPFEGAFARVRTLGARYWGLLGKDGRMVLPGRYAWLSPAQHGMRRIALGAVEHLDKAPPNARWGLIQQDGTPVLPVRSDLERVFIPPEGCTVTTGKIGSSHVLIDITDGRVIAKGFDEVGQVREGWAVLRCKGRWGVANLDGSWHIANEFEHASEVEHGKVWLKQRGKWGCYDVASGQPISDERFDAFTAFFEGFACVRRGKKAGYLSLDGTLLGDALPFSKTFRFHDGFAPLFFANGKAGYLSLDGRRIGEKAKWAATFAPSEGRGGFKDQNGKFGVVELDTGKVIASDLSAMAAFSEGVLCAAKDNRWGLLAKDGSWHLEPRFPRLLPGAHGLVRFCADNERWGAIDHAGEVRIVPRFRSIGDFAEGFAPVWRA